jgi:hypothetical protein
MPQRRMLRKPSNTRITNSVKTKPRQENSPGPLSSPPPSSSTANALRAVVVVDGPDAVVAIDDEVLRDPVLCLEDTGVAWQQWRAGGTQRRGIMSDKLEACISLVSRCGSETKETEMAGRAGPSFQHALAPARTHAQTRWLSRRTRFAFEKTIPRGRADSFGHARRRTVARRLGRRREPVRRARVGQVRLAIPGGECFFGVGVVVCSSFTARTQEREKIKDARGDVGVGGGASGGEKAGCDGRGQGRRSRSLRGIPLSDRTCPQSGHTNQSRVVLHNNPLWYQRLRFPKSFDDRWSCLDDSGSCLVPAQFARCFAARARFRRTARRSSHAHTERQSTDASTHQLLYGPWSPVSRTMLKMRLPRTVLPPTKPSFQLTPARGPLKHRLSVSCVCAASDLDMCARVCVCVRACVRASVRVHACVGALRQQRSGTQKRQPRRQCETKHVQKKKETSDHQNESDIRQIRTSTATAAGGGGEHGDGGVRMRTRQHKAATTRARGPGSSNWSVSRRRQSRASRCRG